MIVLIILSIVAIVCCAISAVLNIIHDDLVLSILMILLVVLNIFTLDRNIQKYHAKQNNELETTIVKDVINYHVDSTLTINGVDTTKTYTLIYQKEYE